MYNVFSLNVYLWTCYSSDRPRAVSLTSDIGTVALQEREVSVVSFA